MDTPFRRRFLKAGALFTGSVLAQGVFAKQPEARQAAQPWHKSVDVIVIGSGLAGTTAAIRAAELGASVLLLEKMSLFGGTSLVSGLNFACVNSPFQQKKGIQDSPELYASDMAKVAGLYGSPEHALIIAQNSRRLYDFWTERGVFFKDIKKLAGHSVERALWADGGGRGIMVPLHTHIRDHLKNCVMQNETRVDDIVFNGKGEAIGIEVRENYRFDYEASNDDRDNQTGFKKYYRARKGIIFASGGYCRDLGFMGAESVLFSAAQTIANPGALSGTIKMLARHKAHLVNMALCRFAYPIPTEDLRWGMIVDIPSGKRFINEMNERNVIGPAILKKKAGNGGVAPLIVWDSIGVDNFHDKQRLRLSLESKNGLNGTIYKFDTLEKLAAHFGCDPQQMAAAAARYNQMIDVGKDTDFGKNISEMKGAAVLKAPFYGMVVNPRITYTPGGVRISPRAEILSIGDAKPIKGLYACGEVTGGIHGESRLTAGSSPDCGAFGLIAAESLLAAARS